MMRNTLLSRTPAGRASSPNPTFSTPPPIPGPIPTIRLTTATPCADTSIASSALSPLAPSSSPRKRVVPKKSKLSLLTRQPKEKGHDLSDVARRIGLGTGRGAASTGRGFDIYVDAAEDPDIGEILVVKKQKSRAALDGMKWGNALGDVTNAPQAESDKKEKDKPTALKVKLEEKEKWWSIGRGRKDSKDKPKDKGSVKVVATKAKEDEADSRHRAQSFDSGILLTNGPSVKESRPVPKPTERPPAPRSNSTPMLFGAETATVSNASLLTAPGQVPKPPQPQPSQFLQVNAVATDKPHSGSIALRAMRSVRSMARLGGWAQLRASSPEESEKSETKKEKKGKEKKKEKKSVRSSGSSFEAGGLTPVKSGVTGIMKTVGPNSGAYGTVTSQSSSSTNRLSVGSSLNLGVTQRRSSVASSASASSVEPMSSASSLVGRESRRSSGSSVRWDEGVSSETVKERRAKDAEDNANVKEKKKTKGKTEKKETRRSSEGRRRPALSDLFPHAAVDEGPVQPELRIQAASPDRGTIEEGDETIEAETVTPVKKARPRPVSEQLLGRSRPKAIVGEGDGDGVLSILDAATADLANLINRLDLQATPDASPLRQTPQSAYCMRLPTKLTSDIDDDTKDRGSPVKKCLTVVESPLKSATKTRSSVASLTSLRPYAQSRGKAKPASSSVFSSPMPPPIVIPMPAQSNPAMLIGQQIMPWNVLNAPLMTVDEASPEPRADVTKGTPSARPTHRRTLSPPAPAEDAMPVFQPLRPAKSKAPVAQVNNSTPASSISHTPINDASERVVMSSSMTFGTRPSRHDSHSPRGSVNDENNSPSPAARKVHGHHRKTSSLVMGFSMPIAAEARRGLGMRGTMGSIGSNLTFAIDPEDPDSDIPDELQVILSGASDTSSIHGAEDTLSRRLSRHSESEDLPSPGSPPDAPLPMPELSSSVPTSATESDFEAPVPVFRLIDDEDNEADIDEGASSEEDTKKSFDFTGELRCLNESGASDRRSFVEQLENAFKTPAKINIQQLGFGQEFLQPAFPGLAALTSEREANWMGQSMMEESVAFEVPSDMIVDVDLNGSIPEFESSEPSQSDDMSVELLPVKPQSCRRHLRSESSIGSKPSDGQLNKDFKFGGRPPVNTAVIPEEETKPLTLSDIIPPPSHHSRSPSMASMQEEDSSILKSIFAQATEMPPAVPRPRLDSDSSSKRNARQVSHNRNSSDLSFSGFSSFGEVRRGFEFGPDRPAFYPPASESQSYSFSAGHRQQDSIFSIASVSSYGAVINSGSVDPFDYGLPSRSRPTSMDMSMSVDDTFSFIHREPRRQRVDSDASSFYFNAPSQVARRRHRYNDSTASAMSAGPPISLYNRSFGGHRRNDSNTSASSLAHAYGVYGANGGRAAWARHQQERSVDSIMSDFSAVRLGRPGLGDKMLESANDYSDYPMPLSAISASPPQSASGAELGHQSSFDSIIDEDRRSSMSDSLFEKTGHRTSISSDSVFGYDDHHPPSHGVDLIPPNQFRPLSMLSVASAHSQKDEDDTMISMLGGGRVRRRSIASIVEASPCVRAEKRMHDGYPGRLPVGLRRHNDEHYTADASPNKARLVEKISIASTSSYQFGGERMAKAQRGVLERQSLEGTCLSADGEDNSIPSIPRPVFRRPGAANRPRPISFAPVSSGAETPPLSASDGSSISSGSQSSIDLNRLNILLTNATHPIANTAMARSRTRARGHGHRRRISQARASRSSVYETIQEEVPGLSHSPSPPRLPSSMLKKPVAPSPVQVDRVPEPEVQIIRWDDEETGLVLRKYYAFQDEAHETLAESKRTWEDTPFSIFALQSFEPPRHPAGMQALLEHSQKTYGPLPFDLRPHRRRSRTLSRPSPYPRSRQTSFTSSNVLPTVDVTIPNITFGSIDAQPLQEVQINTNMNVLSPPPALNPLKPLSPFIVDFKDRAHQVKVVKENASLGLPVPSNRPRVPSNARRSALGWSKRSAGKTAEENKENSAQGVLMSPNESLRIVRPRPRGRPTPTPRQALRI